MVSRLRNAILNCISPGEVLGTKQTGDFSFRVADLVRDNDILPAVHQAAETILRDHTEIVVDCLFLLKRWLGEGKNYGKV